MIIAEIGVNHGGHLAIALTLADEAKKAGADVAKFQLFNSASLFGDDRIKHLELTWPETEIVCRHCQDIGIEFLCTPFGIEELIFLEPMLERVKISSGMFQRQDFLRAVVETDLPVIASTGMAGLVQIDNCVSPLGPLPLDRTTLMHCVSSYPCAIEDCNLKAITRMKERYPHVGYSDHTQGILAPVIAASLGAEIIEKHLTLSRSAEGPDHKSSIEPAMFRAMVESINDVRKALGDGNKRLLECERQTMKAWNL